MSFKFSRVGQILEMRGMWGFEGRRVLGIWGTFFDIGSAIPMTYLISTKEETSNDQGNCACRQCTVWQSCTFWNHIDTYSTTNICVLVFPFLNTDEMEKQLKWFF